SRKESERLAESGAKRSFVLAAGDIDPEIDGLLLGEPVTNSGANARLPIFAVQLAHIRCDFADPGKGDYAESFLHTAPIFSLDCEHHAIHVLSRDIAAKVNAAEASEQFHWVEAYSGRPCARPSRLCGTLCWSDSIQHVRIQP
ncbi:MAG: hypothetical protein ACREVZ_14650, partial [Burkholderiales bacterium]